MDGLFWKLVNMSVAASWGIMAVIVLRWLLHRAPGWMKCALWAMVAVRLVCPFSLESAFSLIPSSEIISSETVRYAEQPAVNTGIPAINDALNPVLDSSLAPAPGDSVTPLQVWFFVGGLVWAAGLAVFLGYALLSYLRLRRKVGEAVLSADQVYVCDAVRSPFILGVVRPRIYLPSDIDRAQMEYVLAHERAHLKRGDHWWKPLGYLLLAVYWFNPLVWVAYILFCRDIELACDEKVISRLNLDERKAYSNALVDRSTGRRMVMACPVAFGEVGVKERVKAVLHYRKPTFWLIVAAVLAMGIVAVCFLTDPKGSGSLQRMIDDRKEELTERISGLISEAEAARYLLDKYRLTVEKVEGERADCYFGAIWVSTREPEDDPMIRAMYDTADSLPEGAQKTLALEVADDWLAEMRSRPKDEWIEHPIVIRKEGDDLALYYPYVMDGEETLIPLEKFVADNWTEDSDQRYQDGVDIINEALGTVISEAEGYYYIQGAGVNTLFLDEVEWVTDSERAAELGLSEDDMPGGFYVYNGEEAQTQYPLAEECSFGILDWENNYALLEVDRETFLDTVTSRTGIPFVIRMRDRKIVSVTEQYVP
ncbi:MAG: M56 family metallopeptidase [bacterium]|nr:M56 family metallopeptidase [bacterium]